MFRLTAAAEMAAYLLSLNGGSMDKIKLSKLMYLAESEYILTFARPLCDDVFACHELGAVLEHSDNFFKNGPQNNLEFRLWCRWFKPHDKDDPVLHLRDEDFGEAFEDKFSYLTTGSCRIMDALCLAHRDKTSSQMVAMTYSAEVYPEWNNPAGRSQHTIALEDLCRAHGIDDQEIKDIMEGVEEARDIALMQEDLKACEYC